MSFETRRIKEISLGIFDGPHATPNLHEDGAAVFLGIPNITESGAIDLASARWVSETDLPKWTKRVVPQADDIVFTYEATLNRYALIPKNFACCLGRRTALIRPDKSKVDHRYLFYYFFSPEWRAQIESKTLHGATVNRIPLTSFPEFEVRLPDLQQQKAIAGILTTYDDLIETNRRRIALLEESARLLYREWFVQLRFPGHESVLVRDGMPVGWQLKPLADIAPLSYGKALKASDRKKGEVPVYGSSGIVGSHNAALLDGGGIIVGRKGNVGSLFYSHVPCFPIDTVFYIAPAQASYWLFLALHQLNFISSDAAVPGLNRTYAHSLPIVLPSKEVTTAFERLVQPMFEQSYNLIKQNEQLASVRDALLPQLMSGQLDVSRLPLPEAVAL